MEYLTLSVNRKLLSVEDWCEKLELCYEEGLSNVCICVYVSKELYVCVVLDVIDLTGDDKDDLQRAIALSLEESSRAFRETGITDEEQAISR